MAFSLTATVGGTTYSLSDGNPYSFENAEGMGAASVRRLGETGPLQNGQIDLGYRLEPRIVTLSLLFRADSDSELDTHRQTLASIFKPLTSAPIRLTVTRDDGGVRYLDCFAAGPADIPMIPLHRPGHLHRTVVQLRAADPLWHDATATLGTASYLGLSEWWLAGGAIAGTQVLEHVEYPTVGQPWTYRGTQTGNWAVAFITERPAPNFLVKGVFGAANARLYDSGSGSVSASYVFNSGLGGSGGLHTWPGTPGLNFHVIGRDLNEYWYYLSGGTVTMHSHPGGTAAINGTNRAWRSLFEGDSGYAWPPEVPKAVVLAGISLFPDTSSAALAQLATYMLTSPEQSTTVVNEGDVVAYPIITLRGPMIDALIENQTTGKSILLSGTLTTSDVWTIDLSSGNKTVIDQDGVNQFSSIVSPTALLDFNIAPSPDASGGTNVIVVTPGSAAFSTSYSVGFTSKYMSF